MYVGFWAEGKTGVPGEKPLAAKETTNNKLYTRMESTPGFAYPRPDWWEASALTTAPSLAPHFWPKIAKFAKFSTEQICELKFFTLEITTDQFLGFKVFLSLFPNDIYHILRNCFTRIFDKFCPNVSLFRFPRSHTDNKSSLVWSIGHLRSFFLYFNRQLVKAFYFCRE